MIRVLRNGPVIPSERINRKLEKKRSGDAVKKSKSSSRNTKFVNGLTNYFQFIDEVAPQVNETTETNAIESQTKLNGVENAGATNGCSHDDFDLCKQPITDEPYQIHVESIKLENPPTPHRIKLESDVEEKNLIVKTNKVRKEPTITEFFPLRRSNRKTKTCKIEEETRHLIAAIVNDREHGLEVRDFKDKGRGVVTTRRFNRGDYVLEYRGDLVDMKEAKLREEAYAADNTMGCYMYYFKYKNQQYCVDATAESPYLGRLVNHCRNGNLVTRTVEIKGVPRLVLIAKEDIDVGVELTYDYGDRSKDSLKYYPWLAY